MSVLLFLVGLGSGAWQVHSLSRGLSYPLGLGLRLLVVSGVLTIAAVLDQLPLTLAGWAAAYFAGVRMILRRWA